jgi:ribose transport system permease protein
MSDTSIHAKAAEERGLVRFGRFLRDNPVIPLIFFLLLLILAHFYVVMPLRTGRTGVLSAFWVNNLIKFAIPLAMLAACQVLTMLTAGIDLSAGIVATIAAFVCATLTPLIGVPGAVAIAMACGLLVGLLNGFGVGVVRVHPLIIDRDGRARVSRMARHRADAGVAQRSVPVRAVCLVHLVADAVHRLRAASVCAWLE